MGEINKSKKTKSLLEQGILPKYSCDSLWLLWDPTQSQNEKDAPEVSSLDVAEIKVTKIGGLSNFPDFQGQQRPLVNFLFVSRTKRTCLP